MSILAEVFDVYELTTQRWHQKKPAVLVASKLSSEELSQRGYVIGSGTFERRFRIIAHGVLPQNEVK